MFYLNTWKDQLTKIEYYVNGTLSYTQTLSYDSSGNVTSILDTRSSYLTINFEWDGRDLTRRQQYSSITQMKYDDQGIRTYKNSGGVTTTYTLNGYLVLLEKIGTITIYYTYDQQGALLSMNYNGTEFFYITNLQGDIIEMVDINGNTVVKYRYDAWGNIIYSWYDTGLGYNLATINPYRYRGYRYDNDLKLYYLQSRYYDPSVGRFINADSVNYLDPSGYTGLNLYAYCGNNPVMYTDITGEFPILITLIIVGAIVGGGSQYLANTLNGKEGAERWEGVIGATVGGAISLPAFLYTGITIYALAIASGVINGTINEIERSIRYNTEFSFGSAAYDAIIYSTLNMIPFVNTPIGAAFETLIIDTAGFYFADKFKNNFFNGLQIIEKDTRDVLRKLTLKVYDGFIWNNLVRNGIFFPVMS